MDSAKVGYGLEWGMVVEDCACHAEASVSILSCR